MLFRLSVLIATSSSAMSLLSLLLLYFLSDRAASARMDSEIYNLLYVTASQTASEQRVLLGSQAIVDTSSGRTVLEASPNMPAFYSHATHIVAEVRLTPDTIVVAVSPRVKHVLGTESIATLVVVAFACVVMSCVLGFVAVSPLHRFSAADFTASCFLEAQAACDAIFTSQAIIRMDSFPMLIPVPNLDFARPPSPPLVPPRTVSPPLSHDIPVVSRSSSTRPSPLVGNLNVPRPDSNPALHDLPVSRFSTLSRSRSTTSSDEKEVPSPTPSPTVFKLFSSMSTSRKSSGDGSDPFPQVETHCVVLHLVCFDANRCASETPHLLGSLLAHFNNICFSAINMGPTAHTFTSLTGSSITAVWGLGAVVLDDPEVEACLVAMRVQQAMQSSAKGMLWGAVITSGGLLSGQWSRGKHKANFTVGECMREAAPLCDLCAMTAPGGILVTAAVRKAVCDSIVCLLVDTVQFTDGLGKKSEMKKVYELWCSVPENGMEERALSLAVSSLSYAQQHFSVGSFQEALEKLAEPQPKPFAERHRLRWQRLVQYASVATNPTICPMPYRRVYRGWEDLEAKLSKCEALDAMAPSSQMCPNDEIFEETDGAFLRRQLEMRQGGSFSSTLDRSGREPPACLFESQRDHTRGVVEFKDSRDKVWKLGQRLLGKGASGRVYIGMAEDGGLVAIKTLRISARNDVEAIVSEVALLANFRHHPNVVAYHGCSVSKGGQDVMIVMEYVSGGSLSSVLTEFGYIHGSSLVRYCKDVLQGLVFLHNEGLIHRDIKPQNVLVMIDGTCKLTDFGTSVVQTTKTDTVIIGTAPYMAPEQARGNACKESDVWSFGILLLQLVTGVLPWGEEGGGGSMMAFLARLAQSEAMLPYIPYHALSSECGDLLMQCLKRDPSERISASSALQHPFFSTITNPANPSSIAFQNFQSFF